MQDTGGDLYDSLLILAAVVLCCSSIFSRENTFGTRKMLRICAAGNRLMMDKVLLSVLLSAVITAMVYSTRIAIVCKDYLMQYAEAPVQSILIFQNYSHSLSLFQYLLWLFGLRLLGGIIAGLMAAAVSSLSRSDSVSIALGVAVLAAPVIAVGAGVGLVQFVSVYPILGGNIMMQAQLPYQILYGIVNLCFAVGSVFLVRRQWKHRT